MINERLLRLRILTVLAIGFVCAFGQHPDTLWTRIHSFSPGGDIDDGKCVRQRDDGGYIITGSCVPNGVVSHIDVLLLKTDALGDTLWTRTIGSNDTLEYGRAIRELPDGYIIVGHIGPMPVAGVDGLLVKTDPAGEVLWSNTYGDSLSDVINAIEIAPDGGFFMAGNTNCLMHVHNGNMWVFRTDNHGDLLWERTYDIASSDFAWSCTKTLDSAYVISGLAGYGMGGDLWLAKIGTETGIEDHHPDPARRHAISNLPNPFRTTTTISYQMTQPGFVLLEIYDAVGRKIQTPVSEFKDAGTHTVRFAAKTLSGGVYFCRLRVKSTTAETHRMLLVR
ncbi:T9SS type A sorting domain-containing protein [candidate division WOR-3 bacterium]|nr:T9SS type A sorting domain-containing protein [candidate division WOR-3 bacterium]